MSWRLKTRPATDLVIADEGSLGYRGPELSVEAFQEAVAAGVAEVLSQLDPTTRVIGNINVTINLQLASGGGATNVVGNLNGKT